MSLALISGKEDESENEDNYERQGHLTLHCPPLQELPGKRLNGLVVREEEIGAWEEEEIQTSLPSQTIRNSA